MVPEMGPLYELQDRGQCQYQDQQFTSQDESSGSMNCKREAIVAEVGVWITRAKH